MNIFAIIVAAGSGERFGGRPKQLAPLRGMPMLAWSIKRLGDRRNITGLVCVVPPGGGDDIRAGLADFGGGDIDAWPEGGATRQDSVRKGLAVLPQEATHVLIHDAARPCLTGRLISRITDALRDHDAVVPVTPCVDTIVHTEGEYVDHVVDRSHIVGVQTPQAFELSLIRRAHTAANNAGAIASDDGSLVLALGGVLATVEGERMNIKVTYPQDMAIAEAILTQETRE
jgi:2-C-methyl-D-erythritol 4-phosphate cytidylyltransferase